MVACSSALPDRSNLSDYLAESLLRLPIKVSRFTFIGEQSEDIAKVLFEVHGSDEDRETVVKIAGVKVAATSEIALCPVEEMHL
jgi:hypothetical protein